MGLIIRYASHNFTFIMFNPTQRTSKSAPKFLPESQDENVCQPLCIDPQGHGIRELITKTYIKWLKWISHCHHRYPYARHTSSVLKSLKTQSDKKTSKGKLNSSQEDREGKTPYDSSILIKLAVHQDHAISRTRERERDQTHSYWCIPSAPRVNYSLLVMASAVMMKMATGDDFPLRQGAGTGSRLVFGGYRGLRRRNSRSRFLSGGYWIYRNFWRRFHVRGGPRGIHKPGGRAP